MTSSCCNDTLQINFAILSQDYSSIDIQKETLNVINLDKIPISFKDFSCIFYPTCGVFGLDDKVKDINKKPTSYFFKYITFLPPYRKLAGKNFFLLNSIILNIENDLGISRNCFTTESLIELEKEMAQIKTLYDINQCDCKTTLNWNDIICIIDNLNKTNICENTPYKYVELILSVVFITPNESILKTVVNFSYLIDITEIKFI